MGCDIHAFVEYRYKPEAKEYSQSDLGMAEGSSSSSRWWGFGQVDIGRNYSLFGLLAGVRGTQQPVAEPRGVPKDISWQTEHLYALYVVDKVDSFYGEHACSKEDAERWLSKACSSVWREGEHRMITGPDWHTPSWVSTSELETVVERYGERVPPELAAVLAAMKALEKGGCDARLVFWFDN
jgi:hypothetical protein